MAFENGKTTIFAPISGVIVPITDVPDPTFAQKMLGDGIAIDPIEETLYSPCDGKIIQIHSSKHALTIATPEGEEILIHIGIDTVGLKGEGFKTFVSEGDDVKRHDQLIVFDADLIAKKAASLLTLVIITTQDASVNLLSSGLAVSGETPLMDVEKTDQPETVSLCGQLNVSEPIVILNPDGLHARPSAVLASNAKRFQSTIKLCLQDKEVNAKSVVAIMGLSIKKYDSVIISAEGPDSAQAVEALATLVQSGLGENLHVIPGQRKDTASEPAPSKPAPSDDPNVMVGVSASPGLVTGVIYQLEEVTVDLPKEGFGLAKEQQDLEAAITKAQEELDQIENSLRLSADTSKAAIFAAHKELLTDPELKESAFAGLKQGQSAAWAWRASYQSQAEILSKLENPLLAARATDIRDIGERVLSQLIGFEKRSTAIPSKAILVASDLTPSDTANLSKGEVLGFCLTGGSATSHASILARAAGLPAVVAVSQSALKIPNGTLAILDGDQGFLKINPAPSEVTEVQTKQIQASEMRQKELEAASQPAMTIDGFKIKVCGNISGLAEASEIPGLGGEGVGLLRSEFLFLDRTEAPTESEQTASYEGIAKHLGPNRDLIVRTLDVGGDKPLAYMPLPEEINPFLGIRGIRLNMLGTEIFSAQVRSILKVANLTNLGLMFPMISPLFRSSKRPGTSSTEKKRPWA
jgi:phosphocarrier protein FPr